MIRFYNTVLFTCVIFFHCSAQVDTEFWFAPPEISSGHGDTPLVLRISTQSESATVRVSLPANGDFELANFTLPPNTTRVVDLSPQKQLLETSAYNTVMKTGLHIVSSGPITAYYEEASFYNAEIFVLKGKNAIGRRFLIAAQNFYDNSADYSPLPYFSLDIVATQNNTVIKIRPTKNFVGNQGTDVITIRLNAGETYSLKKPSLLARDNPIGTIIESSKPIALTVKDDSVINGGCRDLLGDQLIPVEVVGKEYIVVKGFLNSTEYFFVTATENNTRVYLKGSSTPAAIMSAGEIQKFPVDISAVHVQSDKRILIVQVTGFGCELGMTVLPPVNCTGSQQIGFTRSTAEFFGLNILVRKEGVPHFTLNGNAALIPPGVFKPVVGTNDKWYSTQLSFASFDVPVNQSSLIKNEHYSFQAGIINGNEVTSARYGFFSSYSTLFIGDDFDFCEGATAIIDAGSGKDSYLWSTGETTQAIEVDKTGDYWVRVTREDCILYDTIHVNERTPKVDLGPDVEVCIGVVAVVDGQDNFSWLWSDGSTQQYLQTDVLGKYWVNVFDNVGCQASDTIVIKQYLFDFADDTSIELRYVSVDTADEKKIDLAWTTSEAERREDNKVFIYKRPFETTEWQLLRKVPADVSSIVDTQENITDATVFEFYVSLADQCENERIFSKTHNTIKLAGDGDDVSDLTNFNWNYYHNWDHGVEQYELWRKLENGQKFSFVAKLNGDAKDFSALLAGDAFHHKYVIRAKESGGGGESWSNAIDFDFEHLVFVPNVFTPNDDPYNQFFEITNIELYKDSRLLIVDRWGKTVFESSGYQNDWDGGAVSGGIYYYILRLNRNELEPLKGSLSIIK